MDHLSYHVCGALPVTQLHLIVTRCHHHEAWVVDSRVQTQYDGDPQVLASTVSEFGPFDSLDTVGRSVASILREQLDVLRECEISAG